jgi:hypothetical protein
VSTGPLAQEVEELVTLRDGEFWLTAGMAFSGQASLALLHQGIPPATDGTGRRLYLARHLAYAPAAIEQGHRHTTTNFQLLFRACRSHTTRIGTTGSFL